MKKLPQLPRFNTIGYNEKRYALQSLQHPLSGYLGGVERSTGKFVTQLEAQWAQTFGMKHAIACNSATSGLFAACCASNVTRDSKVITTPFSMSATAACATFFTDNLEFCDIEDVRYGIDPDIIKLDQNTSAVIVANLFGHPARLIALKEKCEQVGAILIEDNAQSIMATEHGELTGTIGDIGVFSLNVHKHIQCGEGGVIVTNNDGLALSIRDVINHGELNNGIAGLNLRMTETTAAIACAQLKRLTPVIYSRRALALAITEMFEKVPWVSPPREDIGCSHVYYVWAARVHQGKASILAERLNHYGFPVTHRYDPLLPRLFGDPWIYPVAESVNDSLVTFEVCAYDPTHAHLSRMKKVVKQVVSEIEYDALKSKVRR